MSRIEQLKYMYETNRMVIKSLTDDISDAESLKKGPDGQNHIRWLLGHLILSDYQVFEFIGGGEGAGDDYVEWFSGGSAAQDEGNSYPTMEEMRGKLAAFYDMVIARLDEIDEGVLDSEVGERKAPAWKYLTFLNMHEFYHAGQIANRRKMLGRERAFG